MPLSLRDKPKPHDFQATSSIKACGLHCATFQTTVGFMMKGQKKKQINEHCHFLLFPPSGRKDLFKYIQITKLLAFPSAPINDALIQLLFGHTHWREMLVLGPTT